MAAARRAQTSMKQGCDSDRFPVFAVTVDVVILHVVEGRLHVLLVRRGEQPFEGVWAIPGGFKRPGRDARRGRRARAAGRDGVLGATPPRPVPDVRRPGSRSAGQRGDRRLPRRRPGGRRLAAGTDAVDARLWPVADVRRGSTRPRLRPPTHRRRRRRRAPVRSSRAATSPPRSSARRSRSPSCRACTRPSGATASIPPTSVAVWPASPTRPTSSRPASGRRPAPRAAGDPNCSAPATRGAPVRR